MSNFIATFSPPVPTYEIFYEDSSGEWIRAVGSYDGLSIASSYKDFNAAKSEAQFLSKIINKKTAIAESEND